MDRVKKDTALSFRIPSSLKAQLEKTAIDEGRSLSQVCEALLVAGLKAYKHDGRYIREFFARQKRDQSSS
jgi:hypothetical protein